MKKIIAGIAQDDRLLRTVPREIPAITKRSSMAVAFTLSILG